MPCQMSKKHLKILAMTFLKHNCMKKYCLLDKTVGLSVGLSTIC